MIILDYNKFDLINEIDYLFNNEWFFRVKKENNNIVISSNFFRPVFYYNKDKLILTTEKKDDYQKIDTYSKLILNDKGLQIEDEKTLGILELKSEKFPMLLSNYINTYSEQLRDKKVCLELSAGFDSRVNASFVSFLKFKKNVNIKLYLHNVPYKHFEHKDENNKWHKSYLSTKKRKTERVDSLGLTLYKILFETSKPKLNGENIKDTFDFVIDGKGVSELLVHPYTLKLVDDSSSNFYFSHAVEKFPKYMEQFYLKSKKINFAINFLQFRQEKVFLIHAILNLLLTTNYNILLFPYFSTGSYFFNYNSLPLKKAIDVIDFWIKNKYLTDEDIIKNYNYNKKMLLDKWS